VIPIQDLLHRIQWDSALAGSAFEIGYLDHVEGRIVRVPIAAVTLSRRAPEALRVVDAGGMARTIPLHRVRVVWRDGAVIWERPLPV
jgi:uncharacterized protein (UPF0248 family)